MRYIKLIAEFGEDVFEEKMEIMEKDGYNIIPESFTVIVKDTCEHGTTRQYFILMKRVSPMDLSKKRR